VKVVIPVAGAGKQLRPHTYSQPKALIPIAGEPLIAHILDWLIPYQFEAYLFITGYLKEKIENYITQQFGKKINFHFIYQTPRLGLAHAISLLEGMVGDEPLLIILGDTILDTDINPFIANQENAIGVQRVQNPHAYGVVIVEETSSRILQIQEKPKIPKSNLAVAGIYRFKNGSKLVKACKRVLQENLVIEGEYHLSSAINFLLEEGEVFYAIPVSYWFDCGKKSQVIQTNRILLRRLQENGKLPQTPTGKNLVLIPPVYIDPSAYVEESIIGPHVSIGEGAIVKNSILKEGIIGSYSLVENLVATHFIIGSDCHIKGNFRSFNIGDNNEIDFGKCED